MIFDIIIMLPGEPVREWGTGQVMNLRKIVDWKVVIESER
jgi:hypothetical protein